MLHGVLANLIGWHNQVLRPRGRTLQFASLSFDARFHEVFSGWCRGGTLIIVEESLRADFAALGGFIVRNKIEKATLPVVMLHGIAEEYRNSPSGVGSLREVITTGEQLQITPSVVDVFRRHPQCSLHNHYGPSETHVVKASTLPAQAESWVVQPPIGRPIANTQMYVLDLDLHPVPVGVAGELYIGGAGLGRGYLNQPGMTAEKFVANPYSKESGARMYRTGDLGRWRTDGELEFLGRIDEQVKIRGYRIEPGEIEAVLREQGGVREAAVVAREEEGQKRLVAYVVWEEGDGKPSVGELRKVLQGRLPEYMVPSAFVFLERLPLTANGKLDRRALPKPGERPEQGREYVGPRAAVEEILCGIWAKVLGLERVGVEDNFFELGGDSILCLQVVAQARGAELHISAQQMFRYQTIAALVEQLQAMPSTRPTIEMSLPQGPMPLTPIQQWFFEQKLSEPQHWNQSVMLKVPQEIKTELLEAAMQQLLAHHDALRLRFTEQEDGSWRQEYATWQGEKQILEQVDLSSLAEEQRRSVLQAAATRMQASLNLQTGPLLRAGLFNLGSGERRLLLIAHHLVIDGVSWRILLEDLQILCSQLQKGEPFRLLKSSSFGQWAQALAEYAKSEELQNELPYWESLVGINLPPLRSDLRGENNLMGSAEAVHLHFDATDTEALLRGLPKTGRTNLQDALITALVRSLQTYNGSGGALLELEGHGREECDFSRALDLTRTVGWFTTLYPVYIQLKKSTLREDLAAVTAQLRAVPARGLGYGVLRYISNDGRTRLHKLPHADIVFNYLGQFDQTLGGKNWQIASEFSSADRSSTSARFHLLEVNSHIGNRCLHVVWNYSSVHHRPQSIERLAAQFRKELKALISASVTASSRRGILDSKSQNLSTSKPAPNSGQSFLVVFTKSVSKPRIFCVSAYTKDPALVFGSLAEKVGSDVTFYGLWMRETENFSYSEIAANHIREIRRAQPDGPYFVGGHCQGGIAAFEIAKQLTDEKQHVELLVLFDVPNPKLRQDYDALSDLELLSKIVRAVDPNSDVLSQSQKIKSAKARLRYIYDCLKRIPEFRPDMHFSGVKAFLRFFRTVTCYAPQPYPGRILLFRTTDL